MTMMPAITFETKCYENDYRILLNTSRLRQVIDRCQTPFAKKMIFLNNINDMERAKAYADQRVREGVIDAYQVVAEKADEALRFFSIDPETFHGGYYYSIAELVSIYLCETPYLLHFSSDAILERVDGSWIESAIAVMEKNPQVVVANPVWNGKYEEAKAESFSEDALFYYSHGFSDQCYLINTRCFKAAIYNAQHPMSDRYPAHGGDSFEKRVDSYLRTHQLLRITHKTANYLHRNFPSTWPKKPYYYWTHKLFS